MPAKKLPPSLRAEVSKLARLSHVQNGLPPAMRSLPIVAIALGEAISRATKSSSNLIEERMLGKVDDEAFLLGYPLVVETVPTASTTQSKPARELGGRDGVIMMCARCGKQNPNATYQGAINVQPWLRNRNESGLQARSLPMASSVVWPWFRSVGVRISPRT